MVLKNSRSEPALAPQTPSKPISNNGYLTPQTGSRTRLQSPETATPYTPSKVSSTTRPTPQTSRSQATTQDDSAEQFYDWPASDDEELSKAADQASSQSQHAMPPPETPRKAIKTDSFSTPGKRSFDEMTETGRTAWPTPISATKGDDVFTTPATSTGGRRLFSTSVSDGTPTPVRFNDVAATATAGSSFAAEILRTLKSAQVALPSNVRDEIRDICNKQSLFTHGVIKGRDISRSLIAKRDEKIVELQGTIEAMQSERETSRTVIRHLRRELGVAKSRDG